MATGKLTPSAADHIGAKIRPPKNTGPQGTSASISGSMLEMPRLIYAVV